MGGLSHSRERKKHRPAKFCLPPHPPIPPPSSPVHSPLCLIQLLVTVTACAWYCTIVLGVGSTRLYSLHFSASPHRPATTKALAMTEMTEMTRMTRQWHSPPNDWTQGSSIERFSTAVHSHPSRTFYPSVLPFLSLIRHICTSFIGPCHLILRVQDSQPTMTVGLLRKKKSTKVRHDNSHLS